MQRLQRAQGQPRPFRELQRHLLADATVDDLQSSYKQRAFQRYRPLIAQYFGVVIRHWRGEGYFISETDP